MEKIVNREEELKSKFNDVINKVLDAKIGGDVDANFYDKITFDGLVELKKAISQINNIITLKVTNFFISKLQEGGVVSSGQAEDMKQEVNKISANANGYDIRYEAKKILAEVKCNIPVNGKTFGAKQVEGITKDIDGLLDGKTKGGVGNTGGYYKFMVFLNADGVPESVEEILKNDKYKGKIDHYTNPDGDIKIEKERLNPNVVYIVFISETKS
ncbi:MAG: hypothetical protein MJZ33_08775 [Paludibacteraceae bacterium]|nr:hypothetical protein [Paludibacteraceae bacterium]